MRLAESFDGVFQGTNRDSDFFLGWHLRNPTSVNRVVLLLPLVRLLLLQLCAREAFFTSDPRRALRPQRASSCSPALI